MLIPFEQMPESARLWIYQADRRLTDVEARVVEETTTVFLTDWIAHGKELKASYQLAYNQFLILTADDSFNQVSGCSIDASVTFIKALESQLGVSLLNNDKVGFLIDDQVELLPFNSLMEQTKNRFIEPSTPVFDNTIQKLADFKDNWLVDSEDTWVKRYF